MLRRHRFTALLAVCWLVACSSPRTEAPPPRSAAAPAVAGGNDGVVGIELWLERDVFGFDDVMSVQVKNVVDHDLAVFGLCNLQVQGRWNGQWWRVWHVDCSRERRATTWIAPEEIVQFDLETRGWSKSVATDYDAFVLRYLGAVSEPFRFDPDRH